MNHKVDQTSKNGKKKSKKRAFLRNSLLIVGIFLLMAASAAAYEYHQLSPKTHFKNLKAIGSTPTATKSHKSSGGPSGSGKSGKSHSVLSHYKQKSGAFNMLLIGSDIHKSDRAGHSDSMLLIHVDLNNHTYNVLSIPRDTRVYMKGYGYTKLTSVQYISQLHNGKKQGIVDAVKAISHLTGVSINYYAETSYWGLQDMVNSIGGIQMNVPFNVTLTHPWYKTDKGKVITAGIHHLNGKMVAEVVHERDSVPGTDYGRQRLQEEALIGIAKKVMNPSNIPKLPSLSKSVSHYLIATNMTTSDMVSFALGAKSDFHPKKQIHYRQVKGKNEVRYDDILKANNDEVVLNPNQLKSVVQKYFIN